MIKAPIREAVLLGRWSEGRPDLSTADLISRLATPFRCKASVAVTSADASPLVRTLQFNPILNAWTVEGSCFQQRIERASAPHILKKLN